MEKKDSIKSNLIFNLMYQIVTVASPLILTPKLSRVFGADYLGVKSYTFSIVYYFAVFGVLGLDLYGQRRIALEKDNLEGRSHAFWVIFSARFSLVLISLLLFVLFAFFASSTEFEKLVFFCWVIYLIREMINPIWFLQGIEKYSLISILGILSQIIYVVCAFMFINEKRQLPLYVIFYTAIPLLITLCYFPTVKKYIKWSAFCFHEIIDAIHESFVYFVPTIATAIYSMIDKTMLGIFDMEKISTGLYESAEKLVKVALAVSTSTFTIMRTRMSYLYGKNDKEQYNLVCNNFISLSMFLCWPIMFGIMGVSSDFVPVFFGIGFDEVIVLSRYFAIIVPCLTISGLLQAIYIFPFGLQKSMDYYYIFIVIVNVVMNIILIQNIGTKGAIAASIFAELVLAIILLVKARKKIDVSQIFYKSMKYILSAIFMYIYIVLVSNFLNIDIIPKLLIEFFGAMVVYFLGCFMLRDTFLVGQAKKYINILVNKL